MNSMYELLNGERCQVTSRHSAMFAAVYTISISILVVLLYSWRVGTNVTDDILGEVYYGVQIALMAVIGTQLASIVLSGILLWGITKENANFIVPWIIGIITFISLEAVCIVYSNVLRDHINKSFDALCKAEVTFFIARLVFSIITIVGVVKYYQDLRCGISWKEPEAIEV